MGAVSWGEAGRDLGGESVGEWRHPQAWGSVHSPLPSVATVDATAQVFLGLLGAA